MKLKLLVLVTLLFMMSSCAVQRYTLVTKSGEQIIYTTSGTERCRCNSNYGEITFSCHDIAHGDGRGYTYALAELKSCKYGGVEK